MATYAYPVEHYAFWEHELNRDSFPYGQFGENLTVSGLREDTVRVGDIFRIGGALLQVTQPRIPCYKLAMRMAEGPDFPARFQASGRMGFYLRVLEEGEIGAGDSVELIESDEDSVTIADFIRVYLHDSHDPASLKRVLASRDLGDAWRVYLEKMLKKAEPCCRPQGSRKQDNYFFLFKTGGREATARIPAGAVLDVQAEHTGSFLTGHAYLFAIGQPQSSGVLPREHQAAATSTTTCSRG
jgi:MOSC domain-containing protein YiiM